MEDNDFNRQIARELIDGTGATVTTANDGLQAVAAVSDGSFDLVLMDIQMPMMDGYTAARFIRELRPDLPIVALTAHAMMEQRARVLAAGMNDIVTKPILPDVRYGTLVLWLRRGEKQGTARSDRAPGPSVPAVSVQAMVLPQRVAETAAALVPTPQQESAALAAIDGFDLSAALSRVNGDRKMLEHFLRLFRQRNAGLMQEIGAALAGKDPESARRLAHALKGGAGTVGLIELESLAARLEATLARAPQDADGPARRDELWPALENAWIRAMEQLRVSYRDLQVASRVEFENMTHAIEGMYVHLGLTNKQEYAISDTVRSSVERILALFESSSELDCHFASIVAGLTKAGEYTVTQEDEQPLAVELW